MKLKILLPYDVGFPHNLSNGNEQAVISVKAAWVLSVQFHVPIGNDPLEPAEVTISSEELETFDVKLSKKARRLLGC